MKTELERRWMFFRLLYPCQTVLITCYADGKTNIMTSSVLPTSFKPPLLTMGISPARYSYQLIKRQGEFVVNIPSLNLLDKVVSCGMTSGRDVDKFKELGLTPSRAKYVSAPIVNECIAHLECRVVKEVEAGDHMLIIGEVVAAYAEADLLSRDDEDIIIWNLDKANILLHVGGRVFTVARETLKSIMPYSFYSR